jgi:hypothetical protein
MCRVRGEQGRHWRTAGGTSLSNIIYLLLVLATVKFVFFGWILWKVFRPEIKQLEAEGKATLLDPVCMYCESKWTRAVDEGQTRWDGDDLVLVTTYECEHCGLPFWHVQRVPVSKISA